MVAAVHPGAAAAKCTLQTLAEYPLTVRGNQAFVDVSLNGHPEKFLLDTGAFATIVSRRTAAELGLALKRLNGVQTFGVGGGDETDKVTIQDLKIGPLQDRNVDLIVTGRGALSTHLDGLVGESVLAQGDLEIDFAGKIVRQFKPSGCQGDEVVYWGKGYSMAPMADSNDEDELTVYVALNGQRVLAQIDTGASISVVTRGAAERAGVQGEVAAGKSVGMGARPVDNSVAVFQTFAVGDETIRNARLHVADLFDADRVTPINSRIAQKVEGLPQMLLGADFIKAHRIYIARSQRKIYFSYNGGPIFQLPSDVRPKPTPDVDAPPPASGAAAH